MQLNVDQRVVYAATAGTTVTPTRPTVAFLHGAAMDHTVWVLPSRYFARHHYNVLALDLPGHGRSQGPALGSIEALADWTCAVLDAAQVEQAALVGHSMGALVALETAARHPTRVRALALLGTSAPMPVTEAFFAAAKADDHAALDMINIWGHSRSAQLGGNTNPGLWMTGSLLRLLERSAPGVLYADLNACNEYGEGLSAAARVHCPTLLILGTGDTMTPPRGATGLQKTIAGAKTTLLAGCGHTMLAERPNEVLDALIQIV